MAKQEDTAGLHPLVNGKRQAPVEWGFIIPSPYWYLGWTRLSTFCRCPSLSVDRRRRPGNLVLNNWLPVSKLRRSKSRCFHSAGKGSWNGPGSKALSQKLQGSLFQAPVNMKRLDPECGGCRDLWLKHLQVVNIFFYIKIRKACNTSHIPVTQVPPLLYSKQSPSVPRPLAIIYSSGEKCTIQHGQLSGRHL